MFDKSLRCAFKGRDRTVAYLANILNWGVFLWIKVPFSVEIYISLCPVSKNCSCSWSSRAPDASLCLCVHLLADQYVPVHIYIGLRETDLYFQLHMLHFHGRWVHKHSEECKWVSCYETFCDSAVLLHSLPACFSWGFVISLVHETDYGAAFTAYPD